MPAINISDDGDYVNSASDRDRTNETNEPSPPSQFSNFVRDDYQQYAVNSTDCRRLVNAAFGIAHIPIGMCAVWKTYICGNGMIDSRF